MTGILEDVFEITDRGCVVVVDVVLGHCKIGDNLKVGDSVFQISGIEMPNWRPESIRRIQEGWKPPLGLLLKGATKANLLQAVGKECSIQEGLEADG